MPARRIGVALAVLLLVGFSGSSSLLAQTKKPPKTPKGLRVVPPGTSTQTPTITVSPAGLSLAPGAQQRFTAAVSNVPTGSTVVWSATGGTVAGDGTFTAGPVAGPYAVTGTITSTTVSAAAPLNITGPAPVVQYLSDRAWKSMTNGLGPVERDRSNGGAGPGDGGTLTIDGGTFPKGLGTNAASDVRYSLDQMCSTFTAVVGIDDEAGLLGSVVFQVWADGVKRYDSGAVTAATPAKTLALNVVGTNELALIVADGGDGIDGDHADWADAKVTCAGDTTAPTVTTTGPADASTAVPVTTSPTATFSEPMSASLLTTSSVTLVAQGSVSPVAATVTYVATNNTVMIDPAADLAGNTVYTVTVLGGAAGAKDVAGNPLAADKVWTFTTGAAPDTTAPTVTAVAPATGSTAIALTTNAVATFSEAMNAATLTASTVTLVAQGSTTPVSATVTYLSSAKTVTLDPVVDLAGSTVYTATVKGGTAGAKDLAGNALAADKVWTFTTAPTPDTTAPTVTAVVPASGSSGVALTANTTATFSEAMNAATLTAATATLVAQGITTAISATVTYVASTKTVTLDPVVDLTGNTVYTATIKAGTAGAKDLAGNALATDKVWTFTTAAPPDTTAPTVTAVGPAAGAVGAAQTANVTATFSEAMNAATLTTGTVTLVAQGSTSAIAASVTYSSSTLTVTLDPTASLAAGTTYTATIKGGSAGAKDVAGNPVSADKVWSFTTAGASSYLSDRTWTSATNGYGPVERDKSNGEDLSGDGATLTLNSVTYAKGLGMHAGADVRYALGGLCSGFTAVVGVDDEVSTNGSVVFQVFADGVKVYDSGTLTGASASQNVNLSINGVNQLGLVMTDAGDGSDYDHGDWADAQVSCGPDVTAPTVTALGPTAGATGQALNANITATFSESMNAASLTTATVTLVPQGSTSAVAATVTYLDATRTVTLDPTASLAANTTYTATIKGGTAGAKDLAGNGLAADKVWTLTTGSVTVPTGTPIYPGQDAQSIINSMPAGTTFLFKNGVHRMQTIRPRDGDKFNGEPGAILSGARLLTSFTRSGSYWVASGQTQQGTAHGSCLAGYPRCNLPEQLFIDDQVLLHVGTLAEVVPGKWYFDYAADRIYFADDPTGRMVETSVTTTAFEPTANNVTVNGLIVEKYATAAQQGAVSADNRTGWVISANEVRWNHGEGVRGGPSARVTGNKVHHNGQIGVGGSANDMLIETNEIAYNNTAHFDPGWEAGGTKFSETDRLVVRGNFVHHNYGPGLWTDIDNINTLIENNTVEDNEQMGIFHEISYAAVIRNNIARRNGFGFTAWIWGAGILVAASPNVEVYGNTVEGNAHGISAVQQNRGSGAYGAHQISNLYVHDNIVTMTQGMTGFVQDIGDTSYFTSRNNRFDRNQYHLGPNASYFEWMNGAKTETQWKGYGLDVTGTFSR